MSAGNDWVASGMPNPLTHDIDGKPHASHAAPFVEEHLESAACRVETAQREVWQLENKLTAARGRLDLERVELGEWLTRYPRTAKRREARHPELKAEHTKARAAWRRWCREAGKADVQAAEGER